MALDEVHKYPSWAREIKNLHDRYADLQIIYAGSSILDMAKQEGDLSRRALMYELCGMSFREFLDFKHDIKLPILTLEQILSPDFSSFDLFPSSFKPYQFFNTYLRMGYYPFAKASEQDYYRQLRQLVRMVVEYDMAEVKGFDIRQAKKLLQLLFIIAQQSPFKPNLSRLSQRTNIHRNSINNYLYYLEEAKLLSLLQHKNYSISALQKPEKIFLENTNLIYALSHSGPNIETIREVFFYNQLNTLHQINQDPRADFLVDEKYTFEIGGKLKQSRQIRGLQNAWLVKDTIEHKVAEAIPFWLFGFLY